MERSTLLSMRNIEKSFPGVRALKSASIDIAQGSVHALMGENGAGKSTLMKCLFGVYKKDSGSIFLEGEEVDFKNSRDALERGVSMVHQELNQAMKLTVAENIWLGRFPKISKHLPFISDKEAVGRTRELFDRLGLKIDPKAKMERLYRMSFEIGV